MVDSFRPYVVTQGDHLTSLASRFGFDADDVWGHPKNEELRASRGGDRHVLLPGDVLYIPEAKPRWLPVTVGRTNAFVVPLNPVSVVVRFVAEGKPLAGEAYVVTGADVESGTLDGDGYFRAHVPARTTALTLAFPARNEHYTLKVGHLDPPDTPSGVRMRLGLLGFYGRGPASCADGEGHLAFGVRRFQHTVGLPVTGDSDDATSKKVAEFFGR